MADLTPGRFFQRKAPRLFLCAKTGKSLKTTVFIVMEAEKTCRREMQGKRRKYKKK